MTSLAFWRRLSYVLATVLIVTGWSLYIRIGYPKEWDMVRYGMQGAKVWSLCGKPTISSGGLKPDYWVRPLLLGQWELRVHCGDVAGEGPALVVGKSIVYVWPFGAETVIRPDLIQVPLKSYEAFAQAFGALNGLGEDKSTAPPASSEAR